MIKTAYQLPRAYMVAIDASLGILEHVGSIFRGAFHSQAGSRTKEGSAARWRYAYHRHCKYRRVYGFWYFRARLSVVMRMADIIARGVHMAFNEFITLPIRNDLTLTKYN